MSSSAPFAKPHASLAIPLARQLCAVALAATAAWSASGCTLFGDGQVADVSTTEVHPDPDPPANAQIATTPDATPIERAPVLDLPLPSGEVIVRQCFGGANEARRGRSGPSRPTSRARPSPAAPATTTPTPAASPAAGAPDADGGLFGGVVGGATGVGSGGGGVEGGAGSDRGGSKGAGEAAPPPPPPEKVAQGAKPGSVDSRSAQPTPDASDAPARGPALSEQTREQNKKTDRRAERDLASPADEADRANADPARNLPDDGLRHSNAVDKDGEAEPAPTYDWGATVYLSNDDSMSLASAQRMLYTLSRGVPLSPGEIRPHELLNYFSFDTVAPPPGETFGVLGSAEREGDTLTVALAVRGANPPRQPLDLTLVVDRSGSMTAEGRMAYTQRGLTALAGNLQRGDRVDLVLFDSEVCSPLEGFVVGRDDPSLLTGAIAQMAPRSATDLDAGLREAYRIQTSRTAEDTHGRNRRVLLITDAELNSGNVSEALVSEVGANLDQHGVHLSGVGVGREFNDHFLDMLTEKGRGAYVYVGSEAVVDRVFGPGFDALVRTVAEDVRFSLDLPDSLGMAKFYGEEASTNAEDIDPIHYHAGTSQLFLQDLAIRDGRLVPNDPITLTVAYRDAITHEPATTELRTTVGALLDGDPHNNRKGRALMAFADWTMAGAMGGSPCGAELDAYRSRASLVPSDAEVAYVSGLIGQRCGVNLASVVPRGVALKVRVDADVAIGSVGLACGGTQVTESLSPSDTVARFDAVTPGPCVVHLDGATPMAAEIDVPETGGDLRCTVRAGRVHCG